MMNQYHHMSSSNICLKLTFYGCKKKKAPVHLGFLAVLLAYLLNCTTLQIYIQLGK